MHNVQSPDAQFHHLQTIAPHLTLEQCQQILGTVGKEEVSQSQANFAGLAHEEDDWVG